MIGAVCAVLMSAGLVELNAEDLKAEIRPGDGLTQPFWNVCSKQFLGRKGLSPACKGDRGVRVL